MPTQKQLDARFEDNVSYEVWWGGTDLRYRKASTEEEARAIADEFAAENHPNVQIYKITTKAEPIDYASS